MLIITSQIFTAFKHYLLDRKDSPGEKNHLKPTGFGLLWKLSKIPLFMPLNSLSKVCEHSRQTGWPDILLIKRALTGDALNVSLLEMRKDWWMPKAEAYEEVYRLIYWREILYFKYDFVSQIRTFSMRLGPKQQKLTRNLTINPTSAKCSYC